MISKTKGHNGVRILQAKLEDLEGILDVQEVLWLIMYTSKDISKKDILELMDPKGESMRKVWKRVLSTHKDKRGESNTWVVKDNDKIVGFSYAVRGSSVGVVGSLYILTKYQGFGFGKKLMNKMIVWLDKDKDIILDVASSNKKAIKFYEKFGFQRTSKISKERIKRTGKEIIEYEMCRSKKEVA